MRAFIREEVDLSDIDNNPVDYSELSNIQILWTSIRAGLSKGSLIKAMKDNEYNKKIKERLDKIDEIKLVLNNIISKEMKNSKIVTVKLDRSFSDLLPEVVKSAEFLPYKIERIKDNKDFLECFPDTPIKIRIEVI